MEDVVTAMVGTRGKRRSERFGEVERASFLLCSEQENIRED